MPETFGIAYGDPALTRLQPAFFIKRQIEMFAGLDAVTISNVRIVLHLMQPLKILYTGDTPFKRW